MKGLAITSVVLGIISVLGVVLTFLGGVSNLFLLPLPPVTIILGAVSVFQKESRPIAIAGLLLGLVGMYMFYTGAFYKIENY